MKKALVYLLGVVALSAGLADCGGGGSSPAAPPTVAPTIAPSIAPSVAPSTGASATPTPIATPTIAALKVIGGAPLSATASQLSLARRSGQAHTLAQGSTNGLPLLVESSGMVGTWAGGQAVWVTNAQTSQDVPETSGTITATNNLALNNPGFSQACVGSLAPACIVHPTAWEFGTAGGGTKPIGKQTLTITFADGTTGATSDYVYDGWILPCNAGWAYVNGVPVAQATRATSDVYADCVNSNIVFPKGGIVFANPSLDQYGQQDTIMPTLLGAPVFVSTIVNVSMASVVSGITFAVNTQDGGTAKVFFDSQAVVPTIGPPNVTEGMALHSNASGSFNF